MLSLSGYIALLMSSVLYNYYLNRFPIRRLAFLSVGISFFGCFLKISLVLRWNLDWGIGDFVFLLFSTLVTTTLVLSFINMPLNVLYTKITPPKIEATVFAFITSANNLAFNFLSSMTGAMINDYYVGVTNENMDNYYILVLIGLASSVISIFLIPLIPSEKDIDGAKAKGEEEMVEGGQDATKKTK